MLCTNERFVLHNLLQRKEASHMKILPVRTSNLFRSRHVLIATLACAVVLGAASVAIAADDAAPADKATPTSLPAVGEWDGVTAQATLDGPYEDPRHLNVPFGIISYFNHPWRGFMDTWPASRYLDIVGANWNVDAKYAAAMVPILKECGFRGLRINVSWNNIGWDDKMDPGQRQRMQEQLRIFKANGIRPLILLNAHHGVPCPMRHIEVELLADVNPGDRSFKVKDGSKIRVGYTGPADSRYIAAFPLITKVDDDGTCHLSAPMYDAVKAGSWNLIELKYQPLQGKTLKDGTDTSASMQATLDGWIKYAAEVASAAREAVGDDKDSGFDIEVWNELTFGSNFLVLYLYYDPMYEFGEDWKHRRERPLAPEFRPDAKTKFEIEGFQTLLPLTVDYFADPKNGFPGVRVISGFANEWPWDSGTGLWPGQAGFSRHFYTGGWRDCTPETPLLSVKHGTMDALGNFDGEKDGKEWHSIKPGTNFVPTFRMGCPEFYHTGFKTESLARDIIPDSRLSRFGGHGRYTHNGDFRIAEIWQSEVNYDRLQFILKLLEEGAKIEDPKMAVLGRRLADKAMLRQYVFHSHQGLYRVMLFALSGDEWSLGMLPPEFYKALDEGKDARELLPPGFKALTWMSKTFADSTPIVAPRQLEVKELIEHKPRLAVPGKGTPSHPHQWNRDWFAFMPYQLKANKFAIPYYVVTPNISNEWDKSKDLLDPARYDMPEQDFDVLIGNLAGKGAKVSAYDPLAGKDVDAKVLDGDGSTLRVRLKAVDYPRVLIVEEDKEHGLTIENPKVEVDKEGNVTVSWNTSSNFGLMGDVEGIPGPQATVTYGQDWQNRGAKTLKVESQSGRGSGNWVSASYRVTLPEKLTGVVAVRISVTAGGLTTVWPRWDEDPQGQIVVPAAKKE